ncbi:MAG: hypothetical protein ACEQSQ_00540 [Candidatus Paceibacteria bacterium]
MDIKLENDLRMVTYSKDLIGIKKSISTLASFKNIVGAIKYLNKNGYEAIKNRVGEVLINFTNIDIDKYSNSFNTDNYKVDFDEKREFIITDLSNRNNVRWVYDKKKMIETIYHLETNRLNVQTVEELVLRVEELNKYFINLGEK